MLEVFSYVSVKNLTPAPAVVLQVRRIPYYYIRDYVRIIISFFLSRLRIHLKTAFNKALFGFFFQGLLTLICLLLGNIVTLIEFASFLVWMFYGISMVALLVMRFTKRDVKRPFKVNTFLCCRINDINANYCLYGGAKRIFFNMSNYGLYRI